MQQTRRTAMTTATIELTNAQQETLQRLAQSTGKTERQLLREAVEQYLNQLHAGDRLELLRQARGMWKDRTDLPDLSQLRTELNRFG
jgi:predicted DNA-binding protein